MDSELVSNTNISNIVYIHHNNNPQIPKPKFSFTPIGTNLFNVNFNEGEIISMTEDKRTSSKQNNQEISKIHSTTSKENPNSNISSLNSEKKKSNNYFHSIIKNIKEENKESLKRTSSSIDNISLKLNKNFHERRLFSPSTYTIPKKMFHRPIPKKTLSSQNLNRNQIEIKSLSNMEDISNFYSYTEKCFQLIPEIEKSNLINKCNPINFPFEKIVNEGKKKIVIFHLDETLVHCQAKNIEECQFQISVNLPSHKKGNIGVNIRPNWKKALNLIKDKYIIIVFTASHQTYADAVLDFMDPGKKYFPYRLYRNNCTSVKVNGKEIYIKDLSLFKNINLKDIIIIDNSVVSFTYNLNNGIPILPYYDSIHDNELLCLACYLNGIFEYDDLREANKKFIKLEYYKEKAIDNITVEEEDEEYEDDDSELKYKNTKKCSAKGINKKNDNYVNLGTMVINGSNLEKVSIYNNSNFSKKGVMSYSNELKEDMKSFRILFNKDLNIQKKNYL